MVDFGIFIFLLALGYFSGRYAESKHYKSIEAREVEMVSLPVITAEVEFPAENVEESWLVTGNAVISIDYFKRILASLLNIFGGRISAYESLVDRARREAVLRMKEQAKGANFIITSHIETSRIGQSANQRKSVGSVEALAFGTAIRVRQ